MDTRNIRKDRSRKGVVTGLVILIIGIVWLLRKMDLAIPGWLFEWEMILIYIGLVIGINSNFRKSSSWILIGIGAFFLIDDIYFLPFEIRNYFWPVTVIAIGLVVLFRPKRNRRIGSAPDGNPDLEGMDHASQKNFDRANSIDSVAIFNGSKKNILSKNFKGGETVTVFGGMEINLLQADFEGVIELEAVVVFGGLKLIVPAHWEVRAEATSIMAGVEDKRMAAVQVISENKTLILSGTVILGGIDIVSY